MAEASSFVIASVDRLISNRVVREEPFRRTVPSYLVDVVVEVPFGAHPCSSMGFYLHDEFSLRWIC
jgi:glutaconate CoA-transferase subunit A